MARVASETRPDETFLYYPEGDLDRGVRLLTAITNQDSIWRSVVAQKKHTDWFGMGIEEGDLYYTCERGPWIEALKL